MQDLSAAHLLGDTLWLGSDETAHLEALRLTEFAGGSHRQVAIADLIALPNADRTEIDIEGLAYAPPYLWVVGSHSLKRKAPRPEYDDAKNLQRLNTVVMEKNRYLLGRIPLVEDQ
ncbi:DUF3616 domain-containing protein, partial [Haemophilus parainfluenzae]|uniref:DUF3616 domain-containing protein n=1 Tax=Haemophilus parainfluenzae TaxID=729 RepID=UPI00124BA097